MTIYDFMELCYDSGLCKVKIMRIFPPHFCTKNSCETLWSGMGDEIPPRYGHMEIESFDLPKNCSFTFNVKA